MTREGLQAHDGVVAPVVALPQLPEREPAREHRALQPRAKLQQAREQRLASHRQGQRLQNAYLGMRVHHARECHQGRTGHDAVRIEDDHVVIARAPATHKVGDIARLVAAAFATAAIEHPAGGLVACDEPAPHCLLFGSDVRIACVGEDEEIECPPFRLPRQRTPDRFQARRHAPRVLVVHRHRDGGACAQRPSGHFAELNCPRIAPDERNRKTRDC